MKNFGKLLGVSNTVCAVTSELENIETMKIIHLRRISYGFVMPVIGVFGVVGNILNLIVLTRRNMQGTAYVYMRAYSLASLLAIIFCIPFVLRVLVDNEKGAWSSWLQSFYHVHLELYLSNGFIGVSVMMLSALTLERHASVCRVGKYGRPICGTPKLTAMLLALASFLVYLPNCFRAEIRSCLLHASGKLVYQRRDNVVLLQSTFYQVYKVMLELLFKIGPTVLIAVLNLRIMLAYRRSCKRRRRRMSPATVAVTSSSATNRSGRRRREARGLAEERRLMLLLGSTSLLFFVCVSPMIILNVTLDEDNLSHLPYQVFRSLANLLEITNYSLTFYIYCLFSEDFRRTLMQTFRCKSSGCEPSGQLLRIQANVQSSTSCSPSTHF